MIPSLIISIAMIICTLLWLTFKCFEKYRANQDKTVIPEGIAEKVKRQRNQK